MTETFYDALDRPIRVVGPPVNGVHPATCFTYNLLGSLTKVEAGKTLIPTNSCAVDRLAGDITPQQTYLVDDLGRVRQQIDPLNRTWVMDYDVHGNVIEVTDPKAQMTTMMYEYGGQLKSRSGIGLSVTYNRNTLGQVTQAASDEVIYDYAYDSSHRVATITDSRGPQLLNYTYTTGGRLKTRQQTHQGSEVSRTDYVYDAVGRLGAMWAGHGEVITFLYDAGGRLTEQWLPNGVNTRYAYNADNTLESVEHQNANNVMFGKYAYTYDGVGNRNTAINHDPTCSTDTTETYSYDALNRLSSVHTEEFVASFPTIDQLESYTYDALGNRLSRTIDSATTNYTYNAANELDTITGASTVSLAYDDNGNLTSKSTTGGGTLTLTYDAWDRLTQAQKTWAHPKTYGYDDQGRRIRKTVGTTTHNYLYDGLDIIAEYSGPWATPDALYTHGVGIDAPIIRAEGGVSWYYHQDGLGSVVAMTDQQSQAIGTARYDAWGAVVRQTGGIPQYGYTGREPDATGLVYYRARYYDPETGRFTQPDPIGLQGGTNLYAYALGNPTNYTDPMGTTPRSVAAANANTQNTGYTPQGSGGTGLSGQGYGGGDGLIISNGNLATPQPQGTLVEVFQPSSGRPFTANINGPLSLQPDTPGIRFNSKGAL